MWQVHGGLTKKGANPGVSKPHIHESLRGKALECKPGGWQAVRHMHG